MKVAIQGQENSFHAVAARRLYGDEIELVFCDTFKQTFESLENGTADEAVVAIENSLYGSLNEVYDLLSKNTFWIHGEVYELINFYLFGTVESSLASVNDVYSHPAALGETDAYLDTNLPNATRHEYVDTAAAAEMIARTNDSSKAAIASQAAGVSLGLKILAKHIETHPDNYTRFIALSKHETKDSEANKTSITFRTADTPGSLYAALGVFAKLNINLTKLESRPIVGEVWQYMYYIDFAAGMQDLAAQQALEQLKEYASEIRILGSYKAGVTVPA